MFNLIKNNYSADNVKEYYRTLIKNTVFLFSTTILIIFLIKFLFDGHLDVGVRIFIFIFIAICIKVTLFPLGLIDHIANMIVTITEASNSNSEIGKKITKLELVQYWALTIIALAILIFGVFFIKRIISL